MKLQFEGVKMFSIRHKIATRLMTLILGLSTALSLVMSFGLNKGLARSVDAERTVDIAGITFKVSKLTTIVYQSNSPKLSAKGLIIKDDQSNKLSSPSDVSDVTFDQIAGAIENDKIKAEVVGKDGGQSLVIRGQPGVKISPSGELTSVVPGSPNTTMKLRAQIRTDFEIMVDPSQIKLEKWGYPSITVTWNGSPTVLFDKSTLETNPENAALDGVKTWVLEGNTNPLVVVTIEGTPKETGRTRAAANCEENVLKVSPYLNSCRAQVMLVISDNNSPLKPLIYPGSKGLTIDSDLLSDIDADYFVGSTLLLKGVGPFFIEPAAGSKAWQIERRLKAQGCRMYSRSSNDSSFAELWSLSTSGEVDAANSNGTNGISVGSAKVFDVMTLRKMLNDAAGQLAALSTFNQGQISSAVGNIQGIMRDVSYLNAQVSTALTPAVSQMGSTTIGGLTSNSLSAPGISSTNGQVTLQCPDGTAPQLNANATAYGCTTPLNGTGTNTVNYTNNTTTAVAPSSSQSIQNSTQQQNSTTVTTPSVAGVVPAALPSTALAAPNNFGVASSDILAEQVQLNSQITTLRLLLQGALSDLYLSRNSRAVANRQQTNLGFAISLDPPRQFKHALAEVRIIMRPHKGQSPDSRMSVVNLLPYEKTYNVAKITSKQNSFGAGVVVEAISLGVSTGKSKDRLYLAKDTDTIALQFPSKQLIDRPIPQLIGDEVKSSAELLRTNELKQGCDENNPSHNDVYGTEGNAIVFGWQFRPVLGLITSKPVSDKCSPSSLFQ